LLEQQAMCRNQKKIFRPCKVFNTSVDKFVEMLSSTEANSPEFNHLVLFAPFVCKTTLACESIPFNCAVSPLARRGLIACAQCIFVLRFSYCFPEGSPNGQA